MSRVRAVVLTVVVLALVATGCVGGGGSTALSDPAVRPGTVGPDGSAAAEQAASADPVDEPAVDEPPATDDAPSGEEPVTDVPAETPPAGGFVLDLPDGALPTGPAPGGDDEGAIGDEPVDIAFVQRSIDTVAQQSYRFEMRFAMAVDTDGESLSIAPDAPIAVGAFDGTRQRTAIDLGVMFDAFAGELGDEAGDLGSLTTLFGDDLGIETIVDGTRVYMRAPMLGALAAFGGDDLPAELAELGDGWGVADLADVPGLSADDIAGLTGTQSGSTPDQILAMLGDLGTITEVGPADIGGDATTQFRLVIDIDAALAAGAAELEALGPDAAGQLDMLFGDGPTVDLFIDDAGNLRRLVMAIEATDPAGSGSFSVSTTIDMFDHGADITIDLPSDAVDLTDAFADLAALADGPI